LVCTPCGSFETYNQVIYKCTVLMCIYVDTTYTLKNVQTSGLELANVIVTSTLAAILPRYEGTWATK
jgi:hypothetical protein